MQKIFIYWFFVLLMSIILFVAACVPVTPESEPTQVPATNIPYTEEPVQEVVPTATLTPTPDPPQDFSPPIRYGPNREDFPNNINPLTGLQVKNPELLAQPALLISITHFPPEARPQGGLSFAPWVFEYLIATGSTRLAAIFHGDIPYPEAPQTGDCDVRMEPFVQEDILLGNRVWFDSNEDGIQSPGEQGVGGVCVILYDEEGNFVQKTSTDSNGYFGFNVKAGTYRIEFVKSDRWTITKSDVGFEDTDSDANQESGWTDTFIVEADARHWDAGLIPSTEPNPEDIPPAEVGPIRSARLIHIQLQDILRNSCLIYAGATEEIEMDIPGCATVFKRGDRGVGAMLDISRMTAISEQNYRNGGSEFNYANNLFTDDAPRGGQPASQVEMFFSLLNQSKWVYDSSYQSWLRYVDNTSKQTEFHVDTDRLSDRQIHFENLIVLFVKHEVLAPAIIEMDLQQGQEEDGFIFRDGQMYEIKWSTRAGEYEQKTGLRRPIAFLDKNGEPFPLRPGRSWIVIATPYSYLSQNEPGKWRLRIYAPPGAGIY